MQLVVCRAQMLGMLIHAVMGGNSFAQWQVSVSLSFLVGDVLYDRAVEEAFGSTLPRIILPTEVVTLSTYVRPVASSLTTQLELMLESPRVITSPIDRVSPGTS